MGRQFDVDGETFWVELDEDGGFDCEWLSGPNPGYGFSSGAPGSYVPHSGDGALPVERQVGDEWVMDSIRCFLTMIDPATGFIGD